MSVLISLLVLVVVFGIIAYILSLLPIEQPWMNIARAIMVAMFLLLLLNFVGWIGHPIYLHPVRLP